MASAKPSSTATARRCSKSPAAIRRPPSPQAGTGSGANRGGLVARGSLPALSALAQRRDLVPAQRPAGIGDGFERPARSDPPPDLLVEPGVKRLGMAGSDPAVDLGPVAAQRRWLDIEASQAQGLVRAHDGVGRS